MKSLVSIFSALALFLTACAGILSSAVETEVPESWDFDFDGRAWAVGYQATDGRTAVREYFLEGQSPQDWSAFVGTIHINQRINPLAFWEKYRHDLSRGCVSLKIFLIEQSEDEDSVIFEWRHDGCHGNPPLHEIRRVTRGRAGTYMLSYVEKTERLSLERRSTWLSIIRRATLKPGA